MDYARQLAEFFVERRGKGSALSSADEALVLEWEGEGIPLSVALTGIDTAFERKSEPPRSLSECKRWVRQAFKSWSADGAAAEAQSSVGAEAAPGAAATAGSAPAAPRPRQSVGEQLIAGLEARLGDGDPALQRARRETLAEIRELIASGTEPESLVTIVDEAVADAALEYLEPKAREQVVRAAEAALQDRSMSGEAWEAARAREIIALLGG